MNALIDPSKCAEAVATGQSERDTTAMQRQDAQIDAAMQARLSTIARELQDSSITYTERHNTVPSTCIGNCTYACIYTDTDTDEMQILNTNNLQPSPRDQATLSFPMV